MIRAVIDTNVLFEGLTHLGSSADVVDAWVARRFLPCVSTALALEYEDVLSRKLRPVRGEFALKALQALWPAAGTCRFTTAIGQRVGTPAMTW